jgi:hypothetical protein
MIALEFVADRFLWLVGALLAVVIACIYSHGDPPPETNPDPTTMAYAVFPSNFVDTLASQAAATALDTMRGEEARANKQRRDEAFAEEQRDYEQAQAKAKADALAEAQRQKLAAYTSTDRVAPIEADAQFVKGDDVANNVGLADFMALQIHKAGFRCDSIAAVIPNLFHPGLTVQCDHYRYSYTVEDRGGTWVARFDE